MKWSDISNIFVPFYLLFMKRLTLGCDSLAVLQLHFLAKDREKPGSNFANGIFFLFLIVPNFLFKM